MKHHSRLRIAGIGCAALSATLLSSQTASLPKSEEYLLLGSPNRGAGELFGAANPMDHDNIIVAAMATLNHLPAGEPPIPRGQPGATELRAKELSVPDGSRTDIAVTRDGGRVFRTVRVSHAVFPPYILERSNFLFGDDLTSADVDDEYLHFVGATIGLGFRLHGAREFR